MNSSKTKTVALAALALSGAIAFLNLAGTRTTRSAAGIGRAKPGSLGAPDSAAGVREAYGKLPLAFEKNEGQANEATNFRARGAGYTLSLSATEAVNPLSWRHCRTAITPPFCAAKTTRPAWGSRSL